MSLLNLLVHLNAYEDSNSTNNPSMNHFKWQKDLQGITISEPTSKQVTLQVGESLSLFAGSVSISADNTTSYDLSLKSGTTNNYKISHSGGTAPLFKTPRSEGHDATTEVTITKNGSVLKYESTGGTLFSLIAGGVVVGDEVRISSEFNVNNQGKFKILSLDAVSFTVENSIGAAEGPVTLGADFANQINIYSSAGVQVGDKVDVKSGFSSVSHGTYEITDVSHDYFEFYSLKSLPEEAGILNDPDVMLIYRDAKQFLYIESDKELDVKINGSAITNEVLPLKCGTILKPGVFMSSSSIKSAEIINKSRDAAKVFFVTAE